MIRMTFYEKNLGGIMVNVVPWDLPRHNIHLDTSSAFSNNVPIFTQLGMVVLWNI